MYVPNTDFYALEAELELDDLYETVAQLRKEVKAAATLTSALYREIAELCDERRNLLLETLRMRRLLA